MFWQAIQDGNIEQIIEMLAADKKLAGKNFQPDSLHTDGFPLVQAARQGNDKLVSLLLENGADPNAALDVDDPREFGMPIMIAFHDGRLDIVNLLLDHQAGLRAHPYCGTPFMDRVYNAMWDHPEYGKDVAAWIRKSFADYFDDDVTIARGSQHTSNDDTECSTERYTDLATAPGVVRLLGRVVSLGGQPSLFTVVRHEYHELLERLLTTCPQAPGTSLDWPRGTVFDNVCYGASWCGYPKILDQCRRLCPTLYTLDTAKRAIERAIRSHNRDGGIDQYHQLIESQLAFLRTRGALGETYSDGTPFAPLHWLAEDFIEPRNDGFRCQQLSTPADLLRLAQTFVDFGYQADAIHPTSRLTPMETAAREHQAEYVDFLRNLPREG